MSARRATVLPLVGIALAAAFAGPAGGAGTRQAGPGVAIGAVEQAWDRVTVDYGLGDPADTVLEVTTLDGRTVVVDQDTALSGTLAWDRRIDGQNAPLGTYRLTVRATAEGAESTANARVGLRLLYVPQAPRLAGERVVVPYELGQAARVRLLVTPPGGEPVVAERRMGLRGPNRVTWDLRLGGRRVSGGRYRLQLLATTAIGLTARVAVPPPTRG